jgi:hypothetical protein
MELSKNQVRLKAARESAEATSLIWRAYWSKCVLKIGVYNMNPV